MSDLLSHALSPSTGALPRLILAGAALVALWLAVAWALST
jgi:hypothetical protein